MNKGIVILLLQFVINLSLYTQDRGVFSGAFDTNANIFLRDSSINAINTPQYDHQFFGGEAWLNLNYTINGLTIGARFDMFNNSNLRNPTGSFSGLGIGRWYVKKKLNKLEISAGYLYDQIGSGFIFRAFETRPLFIDNAIYGVSAKYDLGKSWHVMGFVGRQKNAFETYTGNIKGVRLEGFHSCGDENPITLAPGIGFVNRTISDENMDNVVNAIRTYQQEDRFNPNHNAYSATFYNTLTYKTVSFYSEVAFKSADIFYNPFALKAELVGVSLGKLEQKKGSVFYGSLTYAAGNIGITTEAKRTENFNFRIDPNLQLIRGLVNYLVPLNRQNTYRLTARYSPAAQDISEMAFSLDIKYKLSKALSVGLNYSDINTLEGDRLFKEVFTEVVYKHQRKWQLTSGIQFLTYNQEVYEMKTEVPLVKTITPYLDVLYKFTPSRALRTELQYMNTKQDFGSWLFGLFEYSIPSGWIFETSAMYNVVPKKANSKGVIEKTLYPTLGVILVNDAQRYSLRYVKQVEGIVCSGGICRLEPAFSGIRFNLNTTF
ncbi:MAG: hypothetical protein H7X99_07370 [Saprospiraceae bacterium]|nr:hypothetical protein [Saprospiraceae bacterium]